MPDYLLLWGRITEKSVIPEQTDGVSENLTSNFVCVQLYTP